ncbi:methylmalonyl Co-A mutase-associated GTPase MeaB [Chloroflexota bacterium]
MQDIPALVKDMLAGTKTSLARLISLVEEGSAAVPEIRQLISSRLGKAYRVGITGPPGAGKSTLIDGLITLMRSKGLSVGVVAIDPSSYISGGALLGDRVRMQQHYMDDGVFIRSMATRGISGGLCQAATAAVDLLDASGKDIVIVETVGVGQTEVEVIKLADTVVVVLVPEFGDGIQLMKAGFVEIADIVVVNKGDREGADNMALELGKGIVTGARGVEPSVIITQAVNNIGIAELYREIEKRGQKPESSPEAG